jgi:hypothetical protein
LSRLIIDNSCLYIASVFFPENDRKIVDFVSKHAVCVCDDDNDLEMAMACSRAFIPTVTSTSMKEAIDRYPSHFVVTARGDEDEEDRPGIEAAELALSMILEGLAGADTKEEEVSQATAAASEAS